MPFDRITTIQAGLETTYGAGAAAALTDEDGFIVYNPELTVNSEHYNRSVGNAYVRPSRAGLVGMRSVTITFSQELRGFPGAMTDTTDAPQFHVFLQACSLSVDDGTATKVYKTPAGYAGLKSCNIVMNQDGLKWDIDGCRGTAVIKFELGKPAMIDYTFNGIYSDPTADAAIQMDYTTGSTGFIDYTPELVVGGTLDFDPFGDSPTEEEWGHVGDVTLDLRNQLVARKSSTLGSTGVGAYIITGRGTKDDPGAIVSFDVEMPSAHDAVTIDSWWDRFMDQTVHQTAANLHLLVGTAEASKRITVQLGGIFVKSCTLMRMDGDRWGHHIEAVVMGTSGSTSEDDIVITCSAAAI